MKIDAMMAEIRKTKPLAELECLGSRYNWIVKSGKETLGRSVAKYEAVYSALKAVRKARPQPMTIAEAKAAVKTKHPRAWIGWSDLGLPNQSTGWRIYRGIRDEGPPLCSGHATEGQAWKAAAAAIRAEG